MITTCAILLLPSCQISATCYHLDIVTNKYNLSKYPAQALLPTLVWLHPFISSVMGPRSPLFPPRVEQLIHITPQTKKVSRERNFSKCFYFFPDYEFIHACLSCCNNPLSRDNNHQFIDTHKMATHSKDPCVPLTGLEKTRFPRTIMFRNTDFNYLKYCNLERETDTCMKFAKML